MKRIISIKDKFIKASSPGKGRVMFDMNLDINRHINEIEMALYLKNAFGGNIKVLQENKILNLKSYPDYLWNGKYWELKNCTSLRSIDARLHKAIKQIRNASNDGGIVLNISNFKNSNNEITKTITNRLNLIKNLKIIVIIIINNSFYDVIKINEKR